MRNIRSSDFGEDFNWGVATAAYQIEGGCDANGKGPSIWDEFVNRRGKIFGAHHGKEACDFYNRSEDDTALIKKLHIPNHRFSISWSRILPEGTGDINPDGIDFYNRLIDQSLALGIEPWITLYHWDLPLALHRKGGWTNRDIIKWFLNYVEICIRHFGDRVKNWMVLNEPMVFTGAGYFLGVHAPGKKGISNFLAAVHHAVLCQASGAKLIRNLDTTANIGTTFSCTYVEPFRSIGKDRLAAVKIDAVLNRLFIEPLLGLGYPVKDLGILKRIDKYMKVGDDQLMAFDMDFIGIQNYTREVVRHSAFTPYVQARIVSAAKRKVDRTTMNWEVFPEAMYQMLLKFGSYKNIPSLIVTENGAAFPDEMRENKLNDIRRIDYIRSNISQLYKAQKAGIHVKGYFVWTLLDNFEWAEGYHPKFGIVHVDFANQKRTIKSSGFWYRDFIKGDCEI